MKNKFLACMMAAVLMSLTTLPSGANAKTTDPNQYTITNDQSIIRQYEKKLGKMNTTVKTATLTQSTPIKNFDVEWKAGTVYILPWNEKNIKITQKGYLSLNKNDQFAYTINNGTLKIQDMRKHIDLFKEKSGQSTISMPPSSIPYYQSNNDGLTKKFNDYCKKVLYDLIILVPQQQYSTFQFQSEYASSLITDMKISEARSNSSSGIVQYENGTFDKISGSTESGDINLFKCTSKNTDLTAENGDLRLESPYMTNIKLQVENGDINVNNPQSNNICNLSATNGDIYVTPKQFPTGFPKNFNASVENGDVHISLPSNKGFYIPENNIGNGDIHSDFKLKRNRNNYVYGDGKFLLNVSCTNGDITINKAK